MEHNNQPLPQFHPTATLNSSFPSPFANLSSQSCMHCLLYHIFTQYHCANGVCILLESPWLHVPTRSAQDLFTTLSLGFLSTATSVPQISQQFTNLSLFTFFFHLVCSDNFPFDASRVSLRYAQPRFSQHIDQRATDFSVIYESLSLHFFPFDVIGWLPLFSHLTLGFLFTTLSLVKQQSVFGSSFQKIQRLLLGHGYHTKNAFNLVFSSQAYILDQSLLFSFVRDLIYFVHSYSLDFFFGIVSYCTACTGMM